MAKKNKWKPAYQSKAVSRAMSRKVPTVGIIVDGGVYYVRCDDVRDDYKRCTADLQDVQRNLAAGERLTPNGRRAHTEIRRQCRNLARIRYVCARVERGDKVAGWFDSLDEALRFKPKDKGREN